MANSFRDEFRWKNISLNCAEFSSFSRPKWTSQGKYLVYRWFVALFFIVTIFLDRDFFGGWYTGYFTGWGLATITIYVSVYAVVCSYQYYRSKTQPTVSLVIENNKNEYDVQPIQYEDELNSGIVWGYKIVWVLFNVAAVNSMIVTIGYWGALYSTYDGPKSLVGRKGFHNITAHLLNALFMIFEAALAPIPVQLLHVAYSQLYGLLYVAQSVIYWLINGKVFYFFLDYGKKPGLVAIVVVAMFFIIQPLFQLFFYGIYRLREWLLARNEPQDVPTIKVNKRTEEC